MRRTRDNLARLQQFTDYVTEVFQRVDPVLEPRQQDEPMEVDYEPVAAAAPSVVVDDQVAGPSGLQQRASRKSSYWSSSSDDDGNEGDISTYESDDGKHVVPRMVVGRKVKPPSGSRVKYFNIKRRASSSESRERIRRYKKMRIDEAGHQTGRGQPLEKEDLDEQMKYYRKEEQRLRDAEQANAEERHSEDDDPEEKDPEFRVDRVGEWRYRKFNSTATEYVIRIRPPKTSDEMTPKKVLPRFKRILDQLLNQVITRGMKKNDMIKLSINHHSLDNSINLPPMRVDQLNVAQIMVAIERALNSHQSLLMEDSVSLSVLHVKMPSAGGLWWKNNRTAKLIRPTGETDHSEYVKRSKSIVEIKNKDYLCFGRALIVARAHVNQDPEDRATLRNYKSLAYPRPWCHTQTRATKELFLEAGIDPDGVTEPLEESDWELLCKTLNSQWTSIKTYYQVFVWNGQNTKISTPMWSHPPPTDLQPYIKVKSLNLYFYNNHVDVITNMTGISLKNYFCEKCCKLHNEKKHTCQNPCGYCGTLESFCYKDRSHVQTCGDCNREFPNDKCFTVHKQNQICNRKKRCMDCKHLYQVNKKRPHVCDSIYCYTCHQTVDVDHVCYITPVSNKYEHVIKNVKVIRPEKIWKILQKDAMETETWFEHMVPEEDSRDEDLGSENDESDIELPANSDSDSDDESRPHDQAEQVEENNDLPPKRPICLYMIFWDSESMLKKLDVEDDQNLRLDPEKPPLIAHQHITNYIVSQIRCSYCETVDDPDDWAINESQDLHWRHRGKSQTHVNSIVYDPVHNVHRCTLGEHIMEQHYFGQNIIGRFYDDAAKLSKQPEGRANKDKPMRLVVAIAHNSRGYDSQFLLRHLYSHRIKPDNVFQKGMKLISLHVTPHLRFEDSFSFLSFPLSNFPKAFDLPEDVSKQYFPYLLNTPENQWYDTPHLPPLKYYEPEMMPTEKRKNFLAWYENNKNQPFYLKQKLGEYCNSDVTLLRKGCMKFINTIREITRKESPITGKIMDGVNPFLVANTAASLTLYIYRYLYMPPDSMVVLDTNYVKRPPHSEISQMWLAWMNEPERMNGKIKHARNGGEYTLPNPNPPTMTVNGEFRKRPPYKVDGFCKENNTIYEFHGCIFHGCERCYGMHVRNKRLYKGIPSLDTNKNAKRRFVGGRPETWQDINERTKMREKEIRDMGYNLVVKWECDFQAEIKADPELQAFVNRRKRQMKPPMNPRECVQGGRVEVFSMYHQCESNEEIQYVDVVSLYPHVMRSKPFPVGVPHIITDNFSDNPTEDYFGIVHCTVLPPSDLLYPVLGYHCRNKLMMVLCRTCAEESDQSKGDCTHDESERCLTGTWTTPELKKAVEKGYEILDLHEVWHFDEQSDELFKDHLNSFIKIKQESSGLPPSVRNGEQTIEEYIDEFFQHENILMEANKITKNESMRGVGKLCSNSLWGKFCQRPCPYKEIPVDDPNEFWQLMKDRTNSIQEIIFKTNNLCIIKLKEEAEFVAEKNYINVVVAGFVTSYARLELYKHMEAVGCSKLLYCDTDSLVFVSPKDEQMLPIGSFIGDLTNEVEKFGKDAYIRTWIAVAPKFYCYEVIDRKTCEIIATPLKAKGVPLSVETETAMNYETFESLIKTNYEWFKDLELNREIFDENLDVVNNSSGENQKPALQDVVYTRFRILDDRTIVSGKQLKQIKCVFDKRRLTIPNDSECNINSVPWGYCTY
jgi:G:T-mismatch repair DNA endonuclease (very short patch repair protein)